jgi:hypothetical protein
MKEMVFETRSGDRFIGIVYEPNPNEFRMFGVPEIFSKEDFDGLFIIRTRFNNARLYLSHDEIKRVRPVTIYDTEYVSSKEDNEM